MSHITVLAHNIRSIHNIGSILRTAEGFGIERVVCSGYTPYPELTDDTRLPHISRKVTEAIKKTALGAEVLVPITHTDDPITYCQELKQSGYTIVGLEQVKNSTPLSHYRPTDKTLLLIGEEVEGLHQDLLEMCDDIVEIPMVGKKESFNVSVATGVALYHLTNRK